MLLLCAFIAGSSIMWATTYKLTKVTTPVSDDGKWMCVILL